MSKSSTIVRGLFITICLLAGSNCFAQTVLLPGQYQNLPGGGARYNSMTGAVHVPGQSVFKSTGRYDHVHNGYYRNAATGRIYNPYTRSYTAGRNLSFRGGQYQNLGNSNLRFNSQTGALHIPGQAIIKPSGIYVQ